MLTVLAVITACAVREASRSDDGRSSRTKTATVRREGASFVQKGLAGVRAGEEGVRGDLPPELSASHRTLPLNLMVLVRNEESGRSVSVRISDRGPLVKGRVLDLSPLAASRLGIKEKSVARVRIEALGFEAGSAGSRTGQLRPANYDAGVFSVHIMVFQDPAQARMLAEKMRRLFSYAEVRATTEGGKRFYRILAGKYRSLKEAESAEKSFGEHGYPASFVLSLD